MNHRQIYSHIGIGLFCLVSAFLYVLFFAQTLSPLYAIEGCDSSVFKLMGQAILHGKTPYVDIFDHKGPMLYCIQAFGQWLIPGRVGLFLLSVIALSISIACWYASARLFTTPRKSIVVVILSLFTYYLYGEYGNLTEDWNLLFISVSYYFILVSLIRNESTRNLLNGSMIGLCLACSFLIRPNDAVALIGAPVSGALAWHLIHKTYEEGVRLLTGIAIGFACIVAIFVVWFASRHALQDLWYGLVGYNSLYTSGIKGLIAGCLTIKKLNYIPFLAALLLFSAQTKDRCLWYILIPTIVAAYVLLGTDACLHYWIAWVPVLFFTYWLASVMQDQRPYSILAVCLFLTLPVFGEKNWLKMPITMCQDIKRDLQVKDTTTLYTSELFSQLDQADKDSIWSYNLTWYGKEKGTPNAFNVLLLNEIVPCNRVPLIFMAYRDSTLQKDMNITAASPKYILYSCQHLVPKSYHFRDSAYIENNYHVISKCSSPEIILFKLSTKE